MRRGQNNHLKMGMEVLLYTLSRRTQPTREELAARFNVHPKTAWRWKKDLDDYHSLYSITPRRNT